MLKQVFGVQQRHFTLEIDALGDVLMAIMYRLNLTDRKYVKPVTIHVLLAQGRTTLHVQNASLVGNGMVGYVLIKKKHLYRLEPRRVNQSVL